MKIEQAHIDQIRKQFAELQSKEDLVKLLSDAKNMLYGEECKPVQLKSLTYYANPTLCKKRYQTFTIKKKSGADRTIHAPVKGLKSILRSLNFVLQCVYEPHEAATGFVLEKSIVDNAKKHVGHHYVLNMDLKDFFHSFDRNRVKMGFMYEPFNLNGDKEPLAFLLASLCTHPFEVDGEEKTVLPQGSPTSPTLTNILCKKLDRRLTGLANRFGATYTRYADDITFSSPHNIYTDEAFNNELKRIIEDDQKLVINPKKTRLQKAGYRQEATGLIVNDKVNVRRRYNKQIRMWLYYWEKYGYEKAEQIFKRDYIADKGHVKKMNARLINVLDGKLEFLKMVKGAEDGTYKKLKIRHNKLLINLDLNKPKIDEHTTKVILSSNEKEVLHDPTFVVNQLKKFTSDPILKWTTHFWDIPQETDSDGHSLRGIEDHFTAVNSRFDEFVVIKKYNNNLWWKVIYPFIFQNKLSEKNNTEIPFKWGEYDLKVGWQYPKLITEWTKNNYDNLPPALKKTPFEMPIPKEFITDGANRKYQELFGKEIRYFGDIIQLFKREIEFREETKDFYYEVKSLAKQEISEFSVNGLESLKEFFFFTYTAPVLKAIRRIFRMIQTRTEHREVIIECKKFTDLSFIELRIIHKNSVSNRDSEDNKITNPSGDLLEVVKNLISICDFEIESSFKDGKFRITYLSPDTKVIKHNNQYHLRPLKQSLDSIYGFTYVLKFPI
ncbi:MAG: RNA-directed DNA polymerase [Bacteroidales bacterium]|nr:RNA-directed DNA polymerase [Bacteroidales bacterium]